MQTSRHKNKQAVVGVVSSVLTVLPVFVEETVYSVHRFYNYALIYELLKIVMSSRRLQLQES